MSLLSHRTPFTKQFSESPVTAESISKSLGGKKQGDGWMCLCPAHEDHNPSLSIHEKGSKILFKCFKGCLQQDVIDALTKRGLWNAKKAKGRPNFGKPIATYKYEDENGNLLYEKQRDSNKNFWHRTLDQGVWKYKLESTRRVLYNLRSILKAKESQIPIIYTEGEKDVDNMISLGFTATTSGGVTGWRPEFAQVLSNCEIILCGDNDEAGREHIQEVGNSLFGLASALQILVLPSEFNGHKIKDVSDFFSAGGNSASLNEMIASAPDFVPSPGSSSNQGTSGWKGKDFEAAKETLKKFGKENLLVSNAGKSFWRWSESGIWKAIDDREVRKKIHEVATVEITKKFVDSVVDLIKTECFADVAFDGEKEGINLLNGELFFDGEQWNLKPHDKFRYRITQNPIRFDPFAKAPRFENYLTEIFKGDPDCDKKSKVLCELLGYCLLSTAKYERFGFLVGPGANGKSVFLAIVEALLGSECVSAVPTTEFENRFQRGYLFGKLANIVSEIAEGGEIADAQLKAIVSGDLMTAEQKFKPAFSFRPVATCIFGSNHLPNTRDFSDALYRRAIVIEFNRVFKGADCDPNLKDKLLGELPGILNIALKHIGTVLKSGSFTENFLSNLAAKKKWRLEADQASQFIEEECRICTMAKISSGDLYRRYQQWATDAGISKKLSRKGLTVRLRVHGVKDGKGTNGVRMLFGIALHKD